MEHGSADARACRAGWLEPHLSPAAPLSIRRAEGPFEVAAHPHRFLGLIEDDIAHAEDLTRPDGLLQRDPWARPIGSARTARLSAAGISRPQTV